MTKPPAPSALAAAVNALRHALDHAAAEIASLEEQRHLIASAPPAKEDVYQAIDNWLESQVSRYRPALREMLGGVVSIPLNIDHIMTDPGRPWLAKPLSLAAASNERIPDGTVSVGALVMVAQDAIRAALKSEVDALLADQPQGLPLDQRRQKLADLDEAIAAKRAALDAMKSEAQAAGLSIA